MGRSLLHKTDNGISALFLCSPDEWCGRTEPDTRHLVSDLLAVGAVYRFLLLPDDIQKVLALARPGSPWR